MEHHRIIKREKYQEKYVTPQNLVCNVSIFCHITPNLLSGGNAIYFGFTSLTHNPIEMKNRHGDKNGKRTLNEKNGEKKKRLCHT